MNGQLTTSTDIRNFMLAGKAHFTLVSKATGARFTYRVSRAKDNDKLFFVSVLTNPDNTRGYTYLGIIREGVYFPGRKSRIKPDAASAKAITWFVPRAMAGNGVLPESVEFWHEGRCGRCARRLTVPSSIASGIGPECRSKVFSCEAA